MAFTAKVYHIFLILLHFNYRAVYICVFPDWIAIWFINVSLLNAHDSDLQILHNMQIYKGYIDLKCGVSGPYLITTIFTEMVWAFRFISMLNAFGGIYTYPFHHQITIQSEETHEVTRCKSSFFITGIVILNIDSTSSWHDVLWLQSNWSRDIYSSHDWP